MPSVILPKKGKPQKTESTSENDYLALSTKRGQDAHGELAGTLVVLKDPSLQRLGARGGGVFGRLVLQRPKHKAVIQIR